MKLLNTQQLAEELKVGRSALEAAITKLDLKPVYEMAQGRGTVAIYEDVIVETLRLYFEEQNKARMAPPPPPPSKGVDLSPLLGHLDKRLDHLNGCMNDALDDADKAKEATAKLLEQNVLLFKAVEGLTAKVDALQAALDVLPEWVSSMVREPEAVVEVPLQPVPIGPKPVMTAPADAAHKRKVAVISLLADQKRLIEKEFGDVFDLRIFSGDEARAGGFYNRVAGCEVAFVMNNFTDRAITDQVKKSGVKVIKVGGGLTRLRTELTNVFLNA